MGIFEILANFVNFMSFLGDREGEIRWRCRLPLAEWNVRRNAVSHSEVLEQS